LGCRYGLWTCAAEITEFRFHHRKVGRKSSLSFMIAKGGTARDPFAFRRMDNFKTSGARSSISAGCRAMNVDGKSPTPDLLWQSFFATDAASET